LIVPVGGLAARRLLGLKSVSECVGRRYEHDGAVAIPLPHPSGASSWLNAPANRERVAEAAALIREELGVLGRR
jgi:uracil-DNA glycosylase